MLSQTLGLETGYRFCTRVPGPYYPVGQQISPGCPGKRVLDGVFISSKTFAVGYLYRVFFRKYNHVFSIKRNFDTIEKFNNTFSQYLYINLHIKHIIIIIYIKLLLLFVIIFIYLFIANNTYILIILFENGFFVIFKIQVENQESRYKIIKKGFFCFLKGNHDGINKTNDSKIINEKKNK